MAYGLGRDWWTHYGILRDFSKPEREIESKSRPGHINFIPLKIVESDLALVEMEEQNLFEKSTIS